MLATDGWYTWGLRGAGGVLTSVADLWKWDRALHANAILDSASCQKLVTPFVGSHAYAWYEETPLHGVGSIEHACVTANGFYAAFDREPSQHLFIAVLGTAPNAIRYAAENLGTLAIDKDIELPPAMTRLTNDELQAWCGTYSGVGSWRLKDTEFIFRVRAVGSELFLEAASEGAFQMLNPREGRYSPNPMLVDRSRAIVAGFARADFTALHEAENPPQPMSLVKDWWQELLDAHGPLQSATVLGEDMMVDKDVRVWAALDFERGSEVLRLEWSRPWLNAISIGPPYPTRIRIVPESATSAVAYSLQEGRIILRVWLEATANGATLRLNGLRLTRGA
jgi:hypothetical protein